jgi:hypothetical protein
MAIKYTDIVHSYAHEKEPKFGMQKYHLATLYLWGTIRFLFDEEAWFRLVRPAKTSEGSF